MTTRSVFSCCWPEVRRPRAVVGELPVGVDVARLATDPTEPRYASAGPRSPGADTALRAVLEVL